MAKEDNGSTALRHQRATLRATSLEELLLSVPLDAMVVTCQLCVSIVSSASIRLIALIPSDLLD